MKLILCRDNSFGSCLLRLAMWCRWSHSAIYDPATGLVYESTMWGGGVRATWFQDWIGAYPDCELRATGITDGVGARAWLDAQVGKPYDWSALLGLLMHREWQNADRWFCSELVEACVSKFGRARFRAEASRVTPRHQDMLADWDLGAVPPGGQNNHG